MEYIAYDVKGAVGVITITRERALNALNSQVLDELNETLDNVDLDTVRCLVLTGAGSKSFVAGADIGEMSTLTKSEGEAFGKKGNDGSFIHKTLSGTPCIALGIGVSAMGSGNEAVCLKDGEKLTDALGAFLANLSSAKIREYSHGR